MNTNNVILEKEAKRGIDIVVTQQTSKSNNEILEKGVKGGIDTVVAQQTSESNSSRPDIIHGSKHMTIYNNQEERVGRSARCRDTDKRGVRLVSTEPIENISEDEGPGKEDESRKQTSFRCEEGQETYPDENFS